MEEKIKNNKILSLIITMSLPPIISMLIQSLYSIVDGIFVGKISNEAFNAISLSFPMINIFLAIAVGIGVGINSLVSRSLGALNHEKARKAESLGLMLSIPHYLFILIIGFSILPFFFGFFTDNKEIIKMGKIYLGILMLGTIFQLIHISIEKIFQANGKMLIPMIAQGLGCVINIILDAVFIFGLDLGIEGAAYATIIGQASSCIYILILAMKHKYLSFKKHDASFQIIKEIYMVGIPSSVMGAVISVLTIFLNICLKPYGDYTVNILGAYFKIQSFIYMPANGLVQGIRPIFGYLYGAGKGKTLKRAVRYSLSIAFIFTSAGLISFLTIPDKLMALFSDDSFTIERGAYALKLIALSFIPSSFSLIYSALYESIGSGLNSLLISLLRQLIVPVLFVVIGIYALGYGYNTVFLSSTVSEILVMVVSISMYLYTKNTNKIIKSTSL